MANAPGDSAAGQDVRTFNANSTLLFSAGGEAPFTRTPANVPASYDTTHNNDAQVPDAVPTITPNKKATDNKKRKEPDSAGAASPLITAKKRQRRPPARTAASRAIPRSLDECEPHDRQLIKMRDDGADWKSIREMWQKRTGEGTATSTLPNRYARLKSNFSVLREEDNALLVLAKREVEESFDAQKWDLVADVVAKKGGEKYAGVVLKRQYKKLMVQGGVQPPPGVVDRDFDVQPREGSVEAEAE